MNLLAAYNMITFFVLVLYLYSDINQQEQRVQDSCFANGVMLKGSGTSVPMFDFFNRLYYFYRI